ncbi:sugar-binding transcriptional regulator [Marinomonas gallaica]|uniref:sugar-binding transcriptional regulator n=1 Tax=Marinomonas gallaica TaxID=1806667 RepID=UPI003A952E80
MAPKTTQKTTDLEFLTKIAIDYYQEGMTQEDISKKYGLGRIKVGKLLKEAKDNGIVDIQVKYHPIFTENIEDKLKKRFNLKEVLISLDQDDEQSQRRAVAKTVSNYLSDVLCEGMTIAIGQGRNLAEIATQPNFKQQVNCTFVASVGGMNLSDGALNADNIARQIAQNFKAKSETLYAPALIMCPTTRQLVLDIPTVRKTLNLAKRADIAICGIGNLDTNSYMINSGWFSKNEIIDAKIQHNLVGEFGGYDFYDASGTVKETPISNRIIGLSIDNYKEIPVVIGVVSEADKIASVIGALRTGALDILATSLSNAKAIISLTE